MGDVILVLAVIAVWTLIGSFVVFLVRLVARDCDDEQRVCELTTDYFGELATVNASASLEPAT